MAVVTARELDDFIFACVGTGNANGRHDGFCTGVDETYFIHIRHGFFDHFRKLDFMARRRTV